MTVDTELTLEKIEQVLENRFGPNNLKLIEELDQRLDQKLDQKLDSKIGLLTKQLDEKFALIDSHFESLEDRFESMDTRVDSLIEGVEYLKVEMRDVKGRVIHLEASMEEVQESLKNLENAESKDALASINHEHRIRHLEKMNRIKPVPPAHLAEI